MFSFRGSLYSYDGGVRSMRLLGHDHDEYGSATTVAIGDRAAASISVGADQRSPSLRFKGSSDVPNEDALCFVENGERVVLAVADAHFGHESSHALIVWLHEAFNAALPATPADLVAVLERAADGPDPETDSESTLLVAVFDRQAGNGWAVNFGDSTLAVVTAAGEYRHVNSKDDRYVAAGRRWPGGERAVSDFTACTGDMLLMFTDGVDECHYRRPATSVQPEHMVELVSRLAGDPVEISRELADLALAGVDGQPGGQDNIALIVVRV